ncbi:MAG: hypothetical protein LUQ70_01720, partial [Methanobacteriaceae archaeon]|nr:hypothetical protein [Methanobacteriaceae archaeon]
MPTPHKDILVLNTLKYYQAEYTEGVPLSILKLDMDLDDDELHEIIHAMKSKGTITLTSGKVKLIETENKSSESSEEDIEEIKVLNGPSPTKVQEKKSPETLPTEVVPAELS